VHLRLDAVEATVLGTMLTEFADMVENDAFDPDDEVRQRLFPAAYRDDDAAADEYREMTESSLRADRADRARACAEELTSGADLRLDDESADRWIRVLNDLRLTLGTRLGATEESDVDPYADDAPPDAQQWAVYHWLTGLQDLLVRALMR
jgi:hypothetical protein